MSGKPPERLPERLGLLWERLDRPEPRQGLTLSRIVQAAVELADAEGLDAVTMPKLAARLGFTTMSLYRHVKGKNEILLLMLDVVATVPAGLDEPGDDWRTGLQRWCQAQWTMLLAHPWIVDLPITGPPVTPNQLTWTDRALRTLRGTALTEADKAGVVLLVAGYILATARMSAELGSAASGESIAAYSALLGELVDPQRFPDLRAAVDAGAYDYPQDVAPHQRQLSYSFGLDRILDGVEALIRHRPDENVG